MTGEFDPYLLLKEYAKDKEIFLNHIDNIHIVIEEIGKDIAELKKENKYMKAQLNFIEDNQSEYNLRLRKVQEGHLKLSTRIDDYSSQVKGKRVLKESIGLPTFSSPNASSNSLPENTSQSNGNADRRNSKKVIAPNNISHKGEVSSSHLTDSDVTSFSSPNGNLKDKVIKNV